MKKTERIHIRVLSSQKAKWQEKAKQKETTLTDYMISQINQSLTFNEVRKIKEVGNKIIASQKQVANNINQIARRINYERRVGQEEQKLFFEQLQEYGKVQKKTLEGVEEIYNLLYRRINKIID